ncbi:hypothetical protein A936_05555 [Enterobacter sp. Ag1]|nr:hypothetical protein A936_05555 [Enterobacter sp. Ag1]
MVDKMNKSLIFCALFFLVSCAQAADKYPKDVTEFLINADDCQHLSGEWDSNLPKEQQKDIEKQVNVICGKAKSQQGALRTRYHNEKSILDVINEYDF